MSNVVDINRNRIVDDKETASSADDIVFEFEDLRVTRRQALKYALASAAVAAVAVVGVVGLGRIQNSGAPSIEEIRNSTPTTQPAGYNPDEANTSGIPTSGAESE